MTLSAYLISVAALHPPFAAIAVAILGVRIFGVIRGILRYLERVVSHETTFRLLTQLRVWFYRALEPLVPARLSALTKKGSLDYTSGDLLSRLVADIDTLQEFYIRIIAPPVVAILLLSIMWFVLRAYDVRFAMTLLTFSLLAGVGLPLLTYLLSRKLGQRMIAIRSALHMGMVDSIQGAADLLAYNQEQEQIQKMGRLNKQLLRLQAQHGLYRRTARGSQHRPARWLRLDDALYRHSTGTFWATKRRLPGCPGAGRNRQF